MPSVLPGDAVWLLVVAALWGVTNPLIKKGGQGIESIKKGSRVKQLLAELAFLAFNWKYLVPFLVNQSGSVLFYLTLASADLSLAVPITNCLTFVITAIAGHFLGEKIQSKETCVGMVLVAVGVTMCILSKLEDSHDQ